MPSQWLVDHRGELLEGLQPLPLEGLPPVVEETPCPAGRVVVPQLLERFLQKVGRVQPLVGVEQQLQALPSREGEVSPARQEGVLLALDEPAFRPGESGVFALADLVHGLLQMAQDVELVVDDQGLRGVALLEGGVAERLPHVHDRQADFAAFLGAEPGEELVQARLGAVLAAEPDGPAADQVADHDAVAVPLADGDLVDADRPGGGVPGPAELLPPCTACPAP